MTKDSDKTINPLNPIETNGNVAGTTPSDAKPVAWITGSGAPRVGQVIAKHFANRGYRIAIHANQSMEFAEKFQVELSGSGTDSLLVQGAVETPEFARTSVQQIVQRFGRIDVLVNSAAIWDWKSLEETTAEDVRRQFEVNTLGSFLCSQAAGLQMANQSSGGAIVLIGDCAVMRPYPDFAAYFTGKGAIETMTKTLAIELAIRNPTVRVNAIMPGPVMLDPSISKERTNAIQQQSLLKRLGRPEDVAQAAFFLATNDFITGVCIPVDGGRSIYAGPSNDAIAHATFKPRDY